MLIKIINPIFSVVLLAVAVVTFAQMQKPDFLISPLDKADKQKMIKQVAAIDDISRVKLGERLRQDKSDIITLQRIVDEKLIKKSDIETWQAAGVVLGNILIADLKRLKWYLYKDYQGYSRALCVPDTDQCLFPTTMISRRIEADAPVEVQRIYDDAYATIQPKVEAAALYKESEE